MGLSFSLETGDASTTVFAFSFTGPDKGYFRDSDVHAFVKDATGAWVEDTGITLVSDNSLQFPVAPGLPLDSPATPNIQIRRIMPQGAPYSNFSRGNNFGKNNMNYSFLQQLYLMHEVLDGFLSAGEFNQQIDMVGHAIVGLPYPTVGTEPARKDDVILLDSTDDKFDARSKTIKAVPDPVLGTDACNRQFAESLALGNSSAANSLPEDTYVVPAGGTDTIPIPTGYSVGVDSILVFIGGVYQHRAHYTETDSSTITWSEVLPEGTEVDVVILKVTV